MKPYWDYTKVEEHFAGDTRLEAKDLFMEKGLPGSTIKFSINEYDYYLQVAMHAGKVDFLGITVSGQHDHNIRALLEVIFRMATRALRRGAYTLEELCNLWIHYPFMPGGEGHFCPQLLDYGYESPSITSPLDAIAKILRARILRADLN